GKSSLINAILGELAPSPSSPGEGIALRTRKISYASQTPWILSGTLKDNILFGLPFRAQWFEQVVHACGLERDVSGFESGWDTLIGERGVTLSGGQRARLALARAVYYDADVVVLDDPLSAVDTNVGRHLYEKCINGILKDKTRILVTHQLQYIQPCDLVLLVENGTITAQGTYDVVMHAPNSKFAETLREFFARPGGVDDTVDDVAGEGGVPTDTTVPDKPPVETEPPPPQDLQKEDTARGTVPLTTYKTYFLTTPLPPLLLLLILLVLGEALSDVSSYFLAHWSSLPPASQQEVWNEWVFAALVVGTVLVSVVRALGFYFVGWRAGKVLFEGMLAAVVRCPGTFFQVTPHGRLMNRFSKDLSLIDEMLPQTLYDFTQCFFIIAGTIVISVAVIPHVLVAVPVVAAVFVGLRWYYLNTSRQVKRLESVTRSPVYSHIPSTLEGLSLVRAFSSEHTFLTHFYALQNENTRMFFMYLSCGRWLGFRLDMLGACFAATVAMVSVALGNGGMVGSGSVGLVLAYVLQLTGSLQWAVRQSAEVENLMISVERVLEYSR
ncbi:Multidrug resistance-associated protein 4, partial [Borealophlyctis nickersoniae]